MANIIWDVTATEYTVYTGDEDRLETYSIPTAFLAVASRLIEQGYTKVTIPNPEQLQHIDPTQHATAEAFYSAQKKAADEVEQLENGIAALEHTPNRYLVNKAKDLGITLEK